MKNDWEKHIESQETNSLMQLSGIDFLPYKNCEGKLYFIELSKPDSDYGGYQAIIVCADDLKILGKTDKQVHLSLIARSFYEFSTIKDFEKQYSKIHLPKLEHGIEFYK